MGFSPHVAAALAMCDRMEAVEAATKTTIYISYEQGVYRHSTLAVTGDLDVGKAQCEDAKAKESDDYHTFEIERTLPGTYTIDPMWRMMFAPEPFVYKKGVPTTPRPFFWETEVG